MSDEYFKRCDNAVGLTSAEVTERVRKGFRNVPYVAKSKSISQIVRDNVVTLFNIVNVILASFVLAISIHEPKYLVNLAFMGVIISNVAIGIVQEIRAKKTVDSLLLLTEPRVAVIRDGEEQEISVDDIVLDDVMLLRTGNQISVDGVFCDGEGFEIDESMLTGESDPVRKKAGDKIYSGSFVVAGEGKVIVTAVSSDTYAAKLSTEIKKSKKNNSQIQNSLNAIIRVLSVIIIPVGLLLAANKLFFASKTVPLPAVVASTVAALVGMIPEGLMLMTSIAFAVGVVNLARKRTLVQTLPSIETLARVDYLCLDKTGTITNGNMDFLKVLKIPGYETLEAEEWCNLSRMTSDELKAAASIYVQKGQNATQKALMSKLSPNVDEASDNSTFLPIKQIISSIPFSSSRKWLASNFNDGTSIVIGAAEFILGKTSSKYLSVSDKLESLASQGMRVIVVCKAVRHVSGEMNLPVEADNLELSPYLIFALGDCIRPDVNTTFDYFKKQGVNIRVISGDHPNTVSAVARRAGVPESDKAVDMTSIGEDTDLEVLVNENTVFGRVTPRQKRQLLHALQNQGHVVAMTGDGVNDVLALKDADCGIAMASGSDAARAGADLVLLDNNMSPIIDSVYEGRRVINNIERVSILFLVKTIYSCLLAVIFIFLPWNFPIYPVQITAISILTIGMPGFFLALRPNRERVSGSFLNKVFVRCVPGGIACTLMVLTMEIVGRIFHLRHYDISALSVFSLVVGGLVILWKVCRPWDTLKKILWTSCAVLFIVEATLLSRLFYLDRLLSVPVIYFTPLVILYILYFYVLEHLRGTPFSKKMHHLFMEKFPSKIRAMLRRK